jgi:hypothetical protein
VSSVVTAGGGGERRGSGGRDGQGGGTVRAAGRWQVPVAGGGGGGGGYCGGRDWGTREAHVCGPGGYGSAAGDDGGGQPGGSRCTAGRAAAGEGPGCVAARDLPGVPRSDGRAARHRHLGAGRAAPAERDRVRSLGGAPSGGLLGGRGPGTSLRAGYPDHALVGPLPRVRAVVASPARSWLQRPGQVLRGLRARAGPGRPRRADPAGRLLRARRPGGRGRGGRAAGRPRPGTGPQRRQRGQRRAARAPAAGRGNRRRDTGGVAGELA